MYQVFGDMPKTSPGSRLLLVGLAWIIPRGSHYITGDASQIARLERITGLARSSIYLRLATLAEADLIEVEDLRGARRYRLNVGGWRVSESRTDPRSSPNLGPNLGLAPIYKEIQREDRAHALEIDRVLRVDALRSEGRSWAEIAVAISEEGLNG